MNCADNSGAKNLYVRSARQLVLPLLPDELEADLASPFFLPCRMHHPSTHSPAAAISLLNASSRPYSPPPPIAVILPSSTPSHCLSTHSTTHRLAAYIRPPLSFTRYLLGV